MHEKVSVIVPTYNYGRFITDAVESAVRQTVSPTEIIVVDDGSSDGTEHVVSKFGSRVRYIRQNNRGVCAARNFGVEQASGEFIAFLDADDIWEPTKIEKQLAKFAEDTEFGLVHCGMRQFDSETNGTLETCVEGDEGWIAEQHVLFERTVINVSGSVIMVRREVFDSVGGFDERLKNGEDWEFCFRVARKYKVGFVPQALVNYRSHGVNAHADIDEMERSTLIAWRKIFSTGDESVRRLRRRSYGNLHKVLAGSFLHIGRYDGFARNVVKSLWFRPAFFGYYLRILVGGRRK